MTERHYILKRRVSYGHSKVVTLVCSWSGFACHGGLSADRCFRSALGLYNPPSAEALRQEAVLVGLVVVAVLGAFAAWRWEWFSGVAITISALALGTFVYLTAEQDGPIALIAAIVKGGPFILAGIVFLMGWWGQQYRSKS